MKSQTPNLTLKMAHFLVQKTYPILVQKRLEKKIKKILKTRINTKAGLFTKNNSLKTVRLVKTSIKKRLKKLFLTFLLIFTISFTPARAHAESESSYKIIQIGIVRLLFMVGKVSSFVPTITPYGNMRTCWKGKLNDDFFQSQKPNETQWEMQDVEVENVQGFTGIISYKQAYRKFKHADVFNVTKGERNESSVNLFRENIHKFINSPNTTIELGNFQDDPAIHFIDWDTKVFVSFNATTSTFISGWKLGKSQFERFERTKNIGLDTNKD